MLPDCSRRIRQQAGALLDFSPPSTRMVSFLVEDYRYFRAVLLEKGLDPDRFGAEDVLLLETDKNGSLKQHETRAIALRRLQC